jgi:DNA-binding response OmpR family regulator
VSAKGKLLLVEDSEAQGAHIRATLERQGYEVHWAQSGIEGLKLARSLKPDLIVLDVVMQDMDGLAVCRWLKMSVESRDIPIIMLTVRGDLQERVEGLNIGADDYLPKPFADEGRSHLRSSAREEHEARARAPQHRAAVDAASRRDAGHHRSAHRAPQPAPL